MARRGESIKRYPIPAIQPHVPQKFEPGDKNAEIFFRENGYAVFSNVATAEELRFSEEKFWEWIESSTDVVRADQSTWDNNKWPGYLNYGIINANGVAHSEFMWFVRGLPSVHQLFSNLWDQDDLITSFDGCGAFRPINRHPEWETRSGWYHTDQNGHNKKGLQSIQGLLNFFLSGPQDGGLVIVPGSNKHFEEMYERFPSIAHPSAGDQIRIDNTAFDEWKAITEEWSLSPIKLCLNPGDFVAWDSRTIHCNSPPLSSHPDPSFDHELRRLVAYISMSPVSLVREFGVLEKRRNALSSGISTNHWAHEFNPVRRTTPQDFVPPVLNDHQRSLVCGKDYVWGSDDDPSSSSSSSAYLGKGKGKGKGKKHQKR